MSKIIIWLINLYQKTPSKAHYSCIFIPTCSEYTKQAVLKYGSIRGVFLGIMRISRCYPGYKGDHYDPVK